MQVAPNGTVTIPLKLPPIAPADQDELKSGTAMMNRRKLPGVATASKRLADGTVHKYYCAWRGDPMLKAEDGTPLAPNDPQFMVAYAAAHVERTKPATGVLCSLVAAYRA